MIDAGDVCGRPCLGCDHGGKLCRRWVHELGGEQVALPLATEGGRDACPRCGHVIALKSFSYCPYCGQAFERRNR